MNVRCPSCETLYRVDPTKVPEEGVQARCAECPAVITVRHLPEDRLTGAPSEPAIETSAQDAIMPPPLVEAEQVSDSTAEPVQQIDDSPEADAAVISVNYGADILDEPPSVVDDTSTVLPHEFGEDELPPPTEAAAVEVDLAPPDVIPPLDFAEPIPTFEEPVPEASIAEEIPPLPEAASPVEAEEDDIPPLDELPPLPEVVMPSEPSEPPEIEIPAPEPEPTQPPALEIMPRDDVAPREPPRRYTRPFMRPSREAAPPAPAEPSGPPRPTAPVFRPTPGMPIKEPPAPAPQMPVDSAPAPTAPDTVQPLEAPSAPRPVSQPPAPEASPGAPLTAEPQPRRPVNPFLSKDPKQKARRLARALVSDMIVYQPQKRQDALAAGTLKEAFEEEIKKSWEEYVDQIGNEMATQTDFFKEALNEILADGNQIF